MDWNIACHTQIKNILTPLCMFTSVPFLSVYWILFILKTCAFLLVLFSKSNLEKYNGLTVLKEEQFFCDSFEIKSHRTTQQSFLYRLSMQLEG